VTICAADTSAFAARTGQLGGSGSTRVILGRTFPIRSVHSGSHDSVPAIPFAAADELGVVIAWKLPQSWPVVSTR